MTDLYAHTGSTHVLTKQTNTCMKQQILVGSQTCTPTYLWHRSVLSRDHHSQRRVERKKDDTPKHLHRRLLIWTGLLKTNVKLSNWILGHQHHTSSHPPCKRTLAYWPNPLTVLTWAASIQYPGVYFNTLSHILLMTFALLLLICC